MTNTTTAANVITAATAITSHDDYVAFWSAPANHTAFVGGLLDPKVLAEASSGDYLAQEIISSDAALYTRLEALSEAELDAEIARLSQTSDWNEVEGKYEYGESDYAWHLVGVIESLRDHRRAQREYTGHGPLTHTPFSVLAGV